MKMKDKKLPILFLILAMVFTFGTILFFSIGATLTGAAIGTNFSPWTFAWVALIIAVIFIGISLLHEEK